MMDEVKKLSDAEIKMIRRRSEVAGDFPISANIGNADVVLLLDHIAAMEAEQRAGANRTAKDAYELGMAMGDFVQQQTERIQELEHDNQLLNKLDDAVNAQANDWGLSSLQDPILDAHNAYVLNRKVKP